jgi:hypothetical protein
MKLTKGTIVAGEKTGNISRFTVEATCPVEVTIGEFVACLSDYRLDEGSLWELIRYLEDRPALITDKEVRTGVNALRMFLTLA